MTTEPSFGAPHGVLKHQAFSEKGHIGKIKNF